MKKLVILLTILVLVGCGKTVPTANTVNLYEDEDSLIIDDVIRFYAGDTLTPEEAAHWDSMNADGGYLLIRGAERYLDTVVNHLHFIFITEK